MAQPHPTPPAPPLPVSAATWRRSTSSSMLVASSTDAVLPPPGIRVSSAPLPLLRYLALPSAPDPFVLCGSVEAGELFQHARELFDGNVQALDHLVHLGGGKLQEGL
eukprot:scaffold11702_cov95-Isochrysis_galbana.AAC.3